MALTLWLLSKRSRKRGATLTFDPSTIPGSLTPACNDYSQQSRLTSISTMCVRQWYWFTPSVVCVSPPFPSSTRWLNRLRKTTKTSRSKMWRCSFGVSHEFAARARDLVRCFAPVSTAKWPRSLKIPTAYTILKKKTRFWLRLRGTSSNKNSSNAHWFLRRGKDTSSHMSLVRSLSMIFIKKWPGPKRPMTRSITSSLWTLRLSLSMHGHFQLSILFARTIQEDSMRFTWKKLSIILI